MHSIRLAKMVASGFGLERVAQARAIAILRCVPSEFKPENGERAFLWPTEIDPQTWRGVRRAEPGASRDLEYISLVEIANAMRVAAARSLRASVALFGLAKAYVRASAMPGTLTSRDCRARGTSRVVHQPARGSAGIVSR